MQKISELKRDDLIYNHIVYDNEYERHLAKHSHSLVEIIYVLKGEVAYTIEDKRFIAKTGDLILINPYAYHFFSITNQQDYEKIGVLFHPSDIDIGDVTKPNNFLLLPCNKGRIYDIFGKMDFYFHNCPENVFTKLLLSLTQEILINIKMFHTDDIVTSHKIMHPLIERAINYINANLFNFSTVKELSAALTVSEGYLKALFTEQLKIPPKKYITEKKMLQAKSMIAKGIPPTQVALQCGYTNYVTFYRLYVKLFGVTPMQDYKNEK